MQKQGMRSREARVFEPVKVGTGIILSLQQHFVFMLVFDA